MEKTLSLYTHTQRHRHTGKMFRNNRHGAHKQAMAISHTWPTGYGKIKEDIMCNSPIMRDEKRVYFWIKCDAVFAVLLAHCCCCCCRLPPLSSSSFVVVVFCVYIYIYFSFDHLFLWLCLCQDRLFVFCKWCGDGQPMYERASERVKKVVYEFLFCTSSLECERRWWWCDALATFPHSYTPTQSIQRKCRQKGI